MHENYLMNNGTYDHGIIFNKIVKKKSSNDQFKEEKEKQ
jgi:hypothetical protein